MPFSGPDDPDLPTNVQGRPEATRKRWVDVFNDSLRRCTARGGDLADCETEAFRTANGAVRMALETVDKKAVELLKTGTWHGEGCPPEGCRFTVEMLDSMVEAHRETLEEVDPPVKLGHDDNQKLVQDDGFPAAGWVRNLRREGQRLLGDLVKVPKKIGELIDAGAFRKRSAEITPDMKIGGKTYPWVFTGLALLGADLPAVEGLEDITKLYQSLKLTAPRDGSRVFVFDANLALHEHEHEHKHPDGTEHEHKHEHNGEANHHNPADHRGDDINFALEFADVKAKLREVEELAATLVKGQTGSPVVRDLFRKLREELNEIINKRRSKMSTKLAEWTAAFINDLPDSAFAYIAPGGSKDDGGRTQPRALRFLPHHGADGVDLPHLRNALGLDEDKIEALFDRVEEDVLDRASLARLPQSKLAPAAKAAALRHLSAHARSEGVGEEEKRELNEAIEKLTKEGIDMAYDEKELRTLLGIEESDDLIAALKKLKEKGDGSGNGSGDSDDLKNMRKELKDNRERIVTLETDQAKDAAATRVSKAIELKKLLPAQREVALKMALDDPKGFDTFIGSQPDLVETGERGSDGDTSEIGDLEPTAAQREAAEQMGVWSPEQRVLLIKQNAAGRGVKLSAKIIKALEVEAGIEPETKSDD